MSVRIVVGEREPIGLALRRLRRSLQAEGVSWEMRRRRYFVPSTQDRRAKKFQKRFKARNATLLAQRAGEQPGFWPAAEFWRRTGKP
jgi:ribosomal protein S21